MTEERDDDGVLRMKVQRGRRRVYEALPAAQDTAEEADATGAALRPAEESFPSFISSEQRIAGARRIIRDYSIWSAGAGLIPIPVLDMAALAALQLKMLNSLSLHYGVEFQQQRARAIVASLIGGFHAGLLSGSILKIVPFVGTSIMALTPAATGGITYAVGMVFMQHFESGGTLLSFDIVLGRERLKKELEDRKGVAAAE